MLKIMLVFQLLIGISTITYASDNAVGNVALWVSGVCFTIIAIIFGISTFLGVKELGKFHLRKKNQIKVKKEKLLPMYSSQKYYFFTLFLCFFILMTPFSFLTVSIYKHFGRVALFSPLLSVVICIYLVHFIKPRVKNSILCAKDKIKERYAVEEYCSVNENDGFSKKIITDVGEKFYYLGHLGGRTSKNSVEAIEIKQNNNIIHIGDMSKTLWVNWNGQEGGFYKKAYCSFIEYNLPFTFEAEVNLYNVIYMDEKSSIIPKYDLIPTITCSESSKSFAERLVNDTIQEYLLELSTRIGKYSISFSGDKITLIMYRTLWSTASSRFFCKKASINGVVESVDEIIKCFDKIIDKIQTENLYTSND